MKILLVGDVNCIFLNTLAKALKREETMEIDVLSLFSEKDQQAHGAFDKIFAIKKKDKSKFQRLIQIFEMVRKLETYDVVNIHYVGTKYRFFYKILMKKTKRFILSFSGSDFYRIDDKKRLSLRGMINAADKITFTNDRMREDFLEYYGMDYAYKTEVCRYGLSVLEQIDALDDLKIYAKELCVFKEKYGIGNFEHYVVCGYNAYEEQRHMEILDGICKLSQQIKKDTLFIFPLTYGDMDYKEHLKAVLETKAIHFLVLESFMDLKDSALLRKLTDVMVHIQDTDQFSGSMQETLYAGNIVINGAWLHYDILDQEGAFYIKSENYDILDRKIEEALKFKELFQDKAKKNKQIIGGISSWKENSKKWVDLYERE